MVIVRIWPAHLCPAVAMAPWAPGGTSPPPLLALVTSSFRAAAWPQYAARWTNVVPWSEDKENVCKDSGLVIARASTMVGTCVRIRVG